MKKVLLLACLSAASLLASRVTAASTSPPPQTEQPIELLLRSTSDFSRTELHVSLAGSGLARLCGCDDHLDGSCKSQPKTARRTLGRAELSALATLASKAQLFEGQGTGGQLDRSFRSLEVRGEFAVTILVTSLNPSFDTGARRQLLDALFTLERELVGAASAPEASQSEP